MALDKTDIKKFIETVKEISPYDFSDYSEKSFIRRIEKIVEDRRISIDELLKKMKSKPAFLEEIVKEITVNTTEIFRDTKTWELLKRDILPKFSNKETIDIWHVGCSTGQEVYSVLILLNELGLMNKARIVATDLNEDVLEVAKKGYYRFREIDEFIDSYDMVMMNNPDDDEKFKNIPHTKYITINRRKNLIKIKPLLLNKAKFIKHDIVSEGNIFNRKFDLIFCRNVLIYFKHQLQNRLFEFFYENLNPDGALIIGRHEGILGNISAKFKKLESIYLKI